MGNLWLKIKVWTKIVLFGLLAVYVLLVVFNNRNNEAPLWVWFGNNSNSHSVLVYMLFSFLAGVLGTILVRTIFGTISQVSELRKRSREERTQRRLADMEAKAAKLQTLPPPAAAPAPGQPPGDQPSHGN